MLEEGAFDYAKSARVRAKAVDVTEDALRKAVNRIEERAWNEGWEAAAGMLLETHKRVTMLEKILEQAHGLICSAENNKQELICAHEHCSGGHHDIEDMRTRNIGPQDWKDAQKAWMDSLHAYYDLPMVGISRDTVTGEVQKVEIPRETADAIDAFMENPETGVRRERPTRKKEGVTGQELYGYTSVCVMCGGVDGNHQVEDCKGWFDTVKSTGRCIGCLGLSHRRECPEWVLPL